MSNFFTHWKTSLAGIVMAAAFGIHAYQGHTFDFTTFTTILGMVGLGGFASDASKTQTK